MPPKTLVRAGMCTWQPASFLTGYARLSRAPFPWSIPSLEAGYVNSQRSLTIARNADLEIIFVIDVPWVLSCEVETILFLDAGNDGVLNRWAFDTRETLATR